MGQLDKLETVLDENLNKKAPFKVPVGARKAIANNLWWIVLILGLLQLWAAWDLWSLGRTVDDFVNYANSVARAYGGEGVSELGFFYYLSLLVLAVDAVILLLAAPALKEMRKTGWTLLFYSLLINVVYGIFRMFAGHGGGFDDFLWAAVTSVIGAYLLFQVRDHFLGKHKAEAAHKSAESHKEEPKEKE